MSRTLRVGSPSYLVARPIDAGLERAPGFDLVHAVPAALVDGLREGALDVALVSSIELFRRPGYRFLDGPAVTGRGEVRSVAVFLRAPLEGVERVVLDPASRAAQALVRTVLPRRTRRAPQFLEVPRGVDPEQAAIAADAQAWLAIGDPALRRALSPNAPVTFSPSAAWTADTGLPFVFAVWIVRAGVELTPDERAQFAAARLRGAAAIPELAQRASREWSLPAAACLAYLSEECRYDPGAELVPALRAFRDAAARQGLCAGDAEIRPIALEPCRA